MRIYFLSGLGADKRAFSRISLPAGYEMQHLEWEPLKGAESLEDYARIMLQKIDASVPFMLAGLSFGGLIAIEMSKYVQPEKLILFSTIANREQMPPLYRLAGKMRLYRLLPSEILKLTLPFLYWFFGPLDKEGKALVASFLVQTDVAYLRWALGQISRWQHRGRFHHSCIFMAEKTGPFLYVRSPPIISSKVQGTSVCLPMPGK